MVTKQGTARTIRAGIVARTGRSCWTIALLSIVPFASAQWRASPAELATARQFDRARTLQRTESAPQRAEMQYVGQAGLPDTCLLLPDSARTADLYTGLKPACSGTDFWSYGDQVYWALDDGQMGPLAAAVSGGHVRAYQFSFGLYADFPGDTLQPLVFVSFYNAPADPVADAANPVVLPPAPASSIAWLFDPIALPAPGNYAFVSGLVDLAALGLDFDLDDTFYVEILPVKWIGAGWVHDPDVHAIYTQAGSLTYGNNQHKLWSDVFVFNPNFTTSNRNGFYDHPAELDWGGTAPNRDQSGIRLVGTVCTGTPRLTLAINAPDDTCVRPGEPITVTLSQACLLELVRGYQAFLAFDPARLTFDAGTYTDTPFGRHILNPLSAAGGTLNVAAGIDDATGQSMTTATAALATLHFTAGAQEGFARVTFRTFEPPTEFSDAVGQAVLPLLVDSPDICIDGTPPEIACPPDTDLQCVTQLPSPALDYAAFVAAGGSAADTGCYAAVHVAHVGDTSNGGAGWPADPLVIQRTYRATDCAGNERDCTQTFTISDTLAPTLLGVPVDRSVNANAGSCAAVPVPPLVPPTAADNCDPNVAVTFTRSDGRLTLTEPYAAADSPVTITWSATDAAGNTSTAQTQIDVAPVNEVVATVQLDGGLYARGPRTITRCITFELWTGPAAYATADVPVDFSIGANQLVSPATVAFTVPCNAYVCITARDKLHTLRRTLSAPEFASSGAQYVADFVAAGKSLVGGNLNDSTHIDILDFSVFIWQWLTNYGSGNTDCAASYPHADVDGDGVVEQEDFNFIAGHFLQQHEANCCGAPNKTRGTEDEQPVLRIAVRELQARGEGHLGVADLNGDGWIDQADITAFAQGARPRPATNVKPRPVSFDLVPLGPTSWRPRDAARQ